MLNSLLLTLHACWSSCYWLYTHVDLLATDSTRMLIFLLLTWLLCDSAFQLYILSEVRLLNFLRLIMVINHLRVMGAHPPSIPPQSTGAFWLLELGKECSWWSFCLLKQDEAKTARQKRWKCGHVYVYIYINIPSRELTYPTFGKGKSSSKVIWEGIC